MPSLNSNGERKQPKKGKIVLTISSAGSGTYDKANAYHTVYLNPPVKVPDADYVSAKLVSASVWNSVPNVLTGINDVFVIAITDSVVFPTEPGNTKEFKFVLTQGQYSYDNLVLALTRTFVGAGLRADTLNITADVSSSYVYFSTGYSGGAVIKANSKSLVPLFGVSKTADFAVPLAPTLSRAPDRAAFNSINSFVLHSSIASPGLPINGRTSSILGVVPINVKPNRLINYTPAYPIEVNAENLQNNEISQVTSYWTTEDGQTPAPMYDDFTYSVEITYYS